MLPHSVWLELVDLAHLNVCMHAVLLSQCAAILCNLCYTQIDFTVLFL